MVNKQYLLDSHALLFAAAEPEKLSLNTRRLLESEHTRVYVSAATVWELLIKAEKGKIDFGSDPGGTLRSFCRTLRADMLPILPQHAYAAAALDPIHKDPFDRMLVAQAKFENLVLITKDRAIPGYGVETLW